ncbi:MAG: DNA internalization-related competence protein ComEC/Rec2 [Deltaproteobacteria bacterium]|nr:DNA internalization-related competence protein ComEC/Rec2 [Deltaproteobacteria bacterium]
MQRPLLPLLFAAMAGISCGYLFEISHYWLLTGLLLGLMMILTSLWMDLKYLILPAVMIVIALLSILNINLYLYQKPGPTHIIHYAGPDILTVEGLISAPPQVSPEMITLTVSSQHLQKDGAVIPVNGLVLLNCVTDDSFKYGQVIRFRTKLRVPHNFHNPGGFDYEKFLRFKGILVHGFISNPANIVVLREEQGHPLRMQLEAFRRQLKTIIRAHAGSPTGEIIQAMILGDQKEIPKAVMDQFNRTGTSHIIAISGFNIGIIAFFSILMVRMIMKASEYLLLRFNITKVSMALSFIPIAIFTFIAGMGISVVRATIMALAFLVAIILGKDRDLYNTLALAALLILVVSPPSLFDISFQLSFSAVAAILFITPKLTALIPKPPGEGRPKIQLFVFRRLYDITLFMIVSIGATLGTLPLIVLYFNRMSLISLLANLAVVPIMGIIALPVCMAIILTAPLSATLTIWLIKLAALLVDISVFMVDYFASISWAAYYLVTPNILEITVYYLLLFFLFGLMDNWTETGHDPPSNRETRSRQRRMLSGGLAGLLFFVFTYALYGYFKDVQCRDLRITAIDVGQGNATLVRFPGGKKMLVDGGGFFNDDFDIGKYVVAPFLWQEKIGKIDIVVLTHVHPDHLNGLKFVVENFNVGEVWSNGQVSDSESFQIFKRVITEKKIPSRLVSGATPPVEIDGVKVQILNPFAPINGSDTFEKFDATNNNSIVMKLTHGAVSAILPADISEPTEARLTRQGANLSGDVLFVPHHGGLTSSTSPFLDSIRPRVAVISCGKDNVFRFPHPDVLDRYQARKIRVLRTDRDGAVTVTTDGRNLLFHTFRERRSRAFIRPASTDGG